MKLLIESAIIFFGTLLAAALLALGEPGSSAPRSDASQGAQSSPLHDGVRIEQP